MSMLYAVYKYPYMAFHGHIGKKPDVWIGEIQHRHREVARRNIMRLQHEKAGTWPRAIKMGRAQYIGQSLNPGGEP